jgi:hypothetical protein
MTATMIPTPTTTAIKIIAQTGKPPIFSLAKLELPLVVPVFTGVPSLPVVAVALVELVVTTPVDEVLVEEEEVEVEVVVENE